MNEIPPPAAPDPVLETARRLFSVDYLYPIQRFVVANALEGRDQIVILPTGAGKSLCFQLASQLLSRITLVVLPLLSLMEDQIRRCRLTGIPAERLRGAQKPGERERILAACDRGDLRLLYATPEALARPSLRGRLARLGLGLLVVDEAHCVAEWGERFRPAYLRLGELVTSLHPAAVAAFTATAGPAILGRIRSVLFSGRKPLLVEESADRPNLAYSCLPAIAKERVLEELAGRLHPPLLIFCRTRAGAERAARTLRERLPGREVFFYHAALFPEERREVEKWFLGSGDGILAATSAFGMGVDKPDIHGVVHRDVPPSVEAYLQESGRAGRDGKPAEAILLFSPGDFAHLETLKDPLEQERYRKMLEYARRADRCRRETLLSGFGAGPPPCSGCDVCSGRAIRLPAGRAEILRAVRQHSRRFRRRQLARLLAGAESFESARGGWAGAAGFGALAGWAIEDIDEALEEMVTSGEILIPVKGLWRHRVAAVAR